MRFELEKALLMQAAASSLGIELETRKRDSDVQMLGAARRELGEDFAHLQIRRGPQADKIWIVRTQPAPAEPSS